MASEDDDLRARRAGSDKEQGYNTVVALERVATESKRVEVLLLHLVLELAWKEGQLMMELILVGGSSVMTVTVSLDTHSGILQVSGIVECLRVVYSAYQGGCTDNLCRPQCQRLEVAQAKEDAVAMQMLKVSCRGKTSGLLLQ
ncbi:uncharacterized protein LOC119276028 isoform X1 [Triticum dicoccoides]|uniref:uncharacterized protein LOC119276028 isoform X1 n=1 Tax=Triticum dicoccoides TaxID=85692 RepID=UPI00188EC151|nr:uncharacterized protein LOC119276028 isoform X1 [Triticum dicoccoides]